MPKTLTRIYVQKYVLLNVEVDVDDIVFINTRGAMADTRCNGHDGELGFKNPKASIGSGQERYLLCKACWQKRGLHQVTKTASDLDPLEPLRMAEREARANDRKIAKIHITRELHARIVASVNSYSNKVDGGKYSGQTILGYPVEVRARAGDHWGNDWYLEYEREFPSH